MPRTSHESSQFFQQMLAQSIPQTAIERAPVTGKGGVSSGAPPIKRIVLNRLRHVPASAHLRNVEGDIYANGAEAEEVRFSFRITASIEANAWTNITRSENEDLAQVGGIYLMIWNPPGEERNHRMYAFCVPASDQILVAALANHDSHESVMLKVGREPGHHDTFVGRFTGTEWFPIEAGWVAILDLGPFETDYLIEGAVAADRVTKGLRGQGFEKSSKVRRAIELHAMESATQYFVGNGFQVDDVHARKPYDLVVSITDKTLRVEVKGTREADASILLTAGEVRAARKYHPSTALYILHGITIHDTPHGPVAQGGVRRVIEPWNPDENWLKPLIFRCRIPQDI